MIEYQIVSPIKKDDCIPLVNSISEFLDMGMFLNRDMRDECLPSFKKNVARYNQSAMDLILRFYDLSRIEDCNKSLPYSRYLTHVKIAYDPKLRDVWTEFCGYKGGNFLGVTLDDNHLSDEVKLDGKTHDALVKALRSRSSEVAHVLKNHGKSCLYFDPTTRKVIEVFKTL